MVNKTQEIGFGKRLWQAQRNFDQTVRTIETKQELTRLQKNREIQKAYTEILNVIYQKYPKGIGGIKGALGRITEESFKYYNSPPPQEIENLEIEKLRKINPKVTQEAINTHLEKTAQDGAKMRNAANVINKIQLGMGLLGSIFGIFTGKGIFNSIANFIGPLIGFIGGGQVLDSLMKKADVKFFNNSKFALYGNPWVAGITQIFILPKLVGLLTSILGGTGSVLDKALDAINPFKYIFRALGFGKKKQQQELQKQEMEKQFIMALQQKGLQATMA